jgi:hypothetical protein
MGRLFPLMILLAVFAEAEAAELTLTRANGKRQGEVVALRWDEKFEHCEASRTRGGKAGEWKEAGSCREVAAYLKEKNTQLQTEIFDIAHRRPIAKPGNLGVLTDGKREWRVNLMTAAHCEDAAPEKCHEPALNAASTLAKKINEAVTAALGR